MTTVASQITSLTIVYSTVYSDVDQRKHQGSASLAFVWGFHRGPVNSPHKGPETRKKFPFDDVIMWNCMIRVPFCHKGIFPGTGIIIIKIRRSWDRRISVTSSILIPGIFTSKEPECTDIAYRHFMMEFLLVRTSIYRWLNAKWHDSSTLAMELCFFCINVV